MEIRPCLKCGEDALVISFAEKYMVRPRRQSKCIGYRNAQKKEVCRGRVCNSVKEAIEDWNSAQNPFKHLNPF